MNHCYYSFLINLFHFRAQREIFFHITATATASSTAFFIRLRGAITIHSDVQ